MAYPSPTNFIIKSEKGSNPSNNFGLTMEEGSIKER
jgi:hypothetical protein